MKSASHGLSRELQTGKAAEHLVCCDLILAGLNAFLADAGLPYDVVVDVGDKMLRVQVKAVSRPITTSKTKHAYRFGTRRAKGTTRRVSKDSIDIMAFVACDIRAIAYMPAKSITRPDGYLVGLVEFRTRLFDYPRRIYSNGTVQKPPSRSRFIQDFGVEKAKLDGVFR